MGTQQRRSYLLELVDTAIVGPHLLSDCFFHVTERMKPRLDASLGYHFGYFFFTLSEEHTSVFASRY